MSDLHPEDTPHPVEGLAAETGQGVNEEANLDARMARYSKARFRALEMEEYTRQCGYLKEAQRLAECGEHLVFRHYYTVGKVRLHAAHFCKQHLLCPLCAIRRGAKALRAYLERHDAIRAAHPLLTPYLVTFTVKNGDSLPERFLHLKHSLQRLHKRRTGSRQVSEVRKASAGVWSYEITNRGNGWHPHVHAIWMCFEPPVQAKLAQEWNELTGDSFVVDVRPITGEASEGFLEVFKYAMKFSDLTLSDNFTAYRSMKGERLLASFGMFREVEVPENLLDDPLTLDDLPYVELLYRYVHGLGYFPYAGSGCHG